MSIISSTACFEAEIGGALVLVRVDPRARALRLRVDRRRRGVTLTVPRRVSRARALAWAAGHGEWIAARLAELNHVVRLEPGATVPLYGLPHRIEWDPERGRRVERQVSALLVGGPAEGLEARLLRWLKAEARGLLDSETRALAMAAGLEVVKVGVGDPVSRWGSCSAGGTIRYSWRLVLAPEFVRRATVAHEVAHLAHMNHGPAFHALVEKLLGCDPKPARDWLRREGAVLHRVGAPRG